MWLDWCVVGLKKNTLIWQLQLSRKVWAKVNRLFLFKVAKAGTICEPVWRLGRDEIAHQKKKGTVDK